MKILLALLGWTLATIATSSSTLTSGGNTPQRSDPVLVRSVLDGDTIEVVGVGRVRLLGIDAPEGAHGLGTAAPFAHEAREKLISLILHRWVRLEADPPVQDQRDQLFARFVRERRRGAEAVRALGRIDAEQPHPSDADHLDRVSVENRTNQHGIGALRRVAA